MTHIELIQNIRRELKAKGLFEHVGTAEQDNICLNFLAQRVCSMIEITENLERETEYLGDMIRILRNEVKNLSIKS